MPIGSNRKVCSRGEAWRRIASRFSPHIPPVERGSTLEWGAYYLPHYYSCGPSLMHKWISSTLDNQFARRGQRAVVIGPRGGAKSTVATLTYVLRQAVMGLEPYILIVSDTESQAIENLANIKLELEDNAHGLSLDYPAAVGQGPIWRENYIRLRNGVVIHAAGTGQAIRGRRVKQHRPSLIVGDDLENDQHIESSLKRERVETWFNRTLMNMGDERTNTVILGSALHRESLLMKLLRRPGWIVRREKKRPAPFRAIEKWPDRMDLWNKWETIYNSPDNPDAERDANRFFKANKSAMKYGAVLCWPDREGLYQLMKLRAEIGAASFDAEKQGNPIDPSTCEWPERYFTHSEFYFEEWPENLIIKAIALDPSKGKTDRRHDYSSFAYGGVSSEGVVYVDLNMAKRPVDQIINDGLDIYQSFNPATLAIETNQFQELLAEDFAEAAEAEGINLHITPIENFTAKKVRVRRLSTLFSQRRIRFKAGSEGAAICVQQIRDFPNGDHDDGPDSLEMLCRCMFAMLEDETENDLSENIKKIMERFQ